jgi:hypothetical protein
VNWLAWYLGSIAIAAVWISAWCFGHAAGTRDAQRKMFNDRRERMWREYLRRESEAQLRTRMTD